MNLKEIFAEVMPSLQKYSPTIASVIGGPVGLAMHVAIPVLAKAFEVPDNNLSAIVKNILNDTNMSDKLSDLEETHCDWMCALTKNVTNLSRAEIHINLEWHKQ